MARKTAPLPAQYQTLLRRLGERLRVLRMRQGHTAKQVAAAAGMSVMTLRSLERGGAGVTMGAYLAVMVVLGIERDLDTLAAAAFSEDALSEDDTLTAKTGDEPSQELPAAGVMDAGQQRLAVAAPSFEWFDQPARDLHQLIRPAAAEPKPVAGSAVSREIRDLFEPPGTEIPS